MNRFEIQISVFRNTIKSPKLPLELAEPSHCLGFTFHSISADFYLYEIQQKQQFYFEFLQWYNES